MDYWMGKAYEEIFTAGLAPEACCFRFFPGLLTGSCVCPILSLQGEEQLYSVTHESKFFFPDTILQQL